MPMITNNNNNCNQTGFKCINLVHNIVNDVTDKLSQNSNVNVSIGICHVGKYDETDGKHPIDMYNLEESISSEYLSKSKENM